MKEKKYEDIDKKEIDEIFTNYFRENKEERAKFRAKLDDKYCKKIFDGLLSEAPLKKQVIRPKFRYNEIYNLVKAEMTKPTLDLHLGHLEQKGFLKKKSKTKYKTAYQVNVITEPKVVQVRKTLFGKEKLVLVEMSKMKKGIVIFPPNLSLYNPSEMPEDKKLFYKD
jgi:hypothetical protein